MRIKFNTDLILKIGVVAFIVIIVILVGTQSIRESSICEQYRDTKLTDVPAKCVAYFTPRRQDTIILR